jgi:peptidoglycan/LPS O-acetylase OafA/YrhL
MATANPAKSPPGAQTTGQPRVRRWRRRAAILLLILAALLAWFWQPLSSYAQNGAAYGARVACSCRFVGGRALGDCRKDFEPGMELIVLSENRQARTVTARFPLLARQTATYYPGEGCRLEPWRE